jgi:hypothetical protein
MACIGNKLQITTGHTHKQTSRRRTETHIPHNLPYTDTPQLSHSIVKILFSRMKKDQRFQHEFLVGMRFGLTVRKTRSGRTSRERDLRRMENKR